MTINRRSTTLRTFLNDHNSRGLDSQMLDTLINQIIILFKQTRCLDSKYMPKSLPKRPLMGKSTWGRISRWVTLRTTEIRIINSHHPKSKQDIRLWLNLHKGAKVKSGHIHKQTAVFKSHFTFRNRIQTQKRDKRDLNSTMHRPYLQAPLWRKNKYNFHVSSKPMKMQLNKLDNLLIAIRD